MGMHQMRSSLWHIAILATTLAAAVAVGVPTLLGTDQEAAVSKGDMLVVQSPPKICSMPIIELDRQNQLTRAIQQCE